MTSLPHSSARPVLLIVLIVIALVLRSQADEPSSSYLSAISGLQGDRPVLSRAAFIDPCPRSSNRSDQGGRIGRALYPSTAKVFR
mgnify:CR=1 FL=1